ncbi:hypothetical protein D3C72_1416440 [compost metagenome]
MYNCLSRTFQRLKRFADNMLPRLSKHLDCYILRNQILFDQRPQEGKFRLRRCGESDFNLLEPDLHQHFEVFQLLLQIHRNDQRLISITQVNATPSRGFRNILLLGPFQACLRRRKVSSGVFLNVFHGYPSFHHFLTWVIKGQV